MRAWTIYQNRDIVDLILRDHLNLKELIQILQDEDELLEERMAVFTDFVPLLRCHSRPEADVLYLTLQNMSQFRSEAFEAKAEHVFAQRMIGEIDRTQGGEEWSAKVKVLAQWVEHHLEEEEEKLLPQFQAMVDIKERWALGREFLKLKSKYHSRQPALRSKTPTSSSIFYL